MKSKQLANVLIKILGLSVCLYAIPTCVGGLIAGLTSPARGDAVMIRMVSSAIGAGVQAVVGIVIICASQKVAGLMFKTDDE